MWLVSEEPGDREDREGHPFVAPDAGVPDRGRERAAIAWDDAYDSNVVKHFGDTSRGKRRIHQTPERGCLSILRTQDGDRETEMEELSPV